MEAIQRNAEPGNIEDTIPKVEVIGKTEKLVDLQKINLNLDPGPTYKYSAEANTDTYDYKRVKRALPPPNRHNRKTCHLYIQTDPLFWEHIYAQVRKIHN